MQSNLMLHTGAHRIEREALEKVQTPESTWTWYPIPHHKLLDQVETTLVRAGYQIKTQAHGLTKEGNRYFGLLEVSRQDTPDSDEFGLVVGVRNSHDKSFPAGLVLGASVFVCDNLSFSGEVKLARKHTMRIWEDLPMLTTRAVGLLSDQRHLQENRFQAYKESEINDTQAHDLVVQALDNHVIPVTKIPQVLQEWREPRHEEFREGKTGWRLWQAFTESLKGNLSELPRRTQALHGLFDTRFGVLEKRNYIAGEIQALNAV